MFNQEKIIKEIIKHCVDISLYTQDIKNSFKIIVDTSYSFEEMFKKMTSILCANRNFINY